VSVGWKDRFGGSEVFVLACGLNIRVFQIMRWSLSLYCTDVLFSLRLVYSVVNKGGWTTEFEAANFATEELTTDSR